MSPIIRHLNQAISLFINSNCPLCQRSTPNEFCSTCQRQLQHCQLQSGNLMQSEQLTLVAWGNYSGTLKRAISALKYETHPQLARPLAHWLAQAWLTVAPPVKLTVVPIPMHPVKQQQRGFNQAELLAESFCAVTRLSFARQGLARARETTAQFHLSSPDRAQNLAGAFSLGKSFLRQPPTSPVLLLDDIYTTGATANSAAQTLRRHGISVYGLAVVARAVKEKK